MTVAFKIFCALLVADSITGIVHWFEDKILSGESKFKFLNEVVRDNTLHHDKPGAMLQISWIENIYQSCLIAWPIAILLALMGAPMVLHLGFFLSGFGNLTHRWSHVRRRYGLISMLQASGLLVSFFQHTRHHREDGKWIKKSDSRRCYCTMTSYLNPILDGVDFFGRLERIIESGRRRIRG